MKKLKPHLLQTILLLASFLCSLNVFAQPNINSVSVITPVTNPNQISVNEVVEIDFRMRYYAEPHNTEMIRAYCIFENTTTGTTKTVEAFYYVDFLHSQCNGNCNEPCEILDVIPQDEYQDVINEENEEEINAHPFKDFYLHGYWKVRFTPEEPGDWIYTIIANDFIASDYYHNPNDIINATNNNKPGFIEIANKRFLRKRTGEFYFPVGQNSPDYKYCFNGNPNCGPTNDEHCEYGTIQTKKFIDNIAAENGNFIRMHINTPGYAHDRNGISLFGKDLLLASPDPNSPTYTKIFKFDIYNLKDAWQMDEILRYAQQKGIYIEVILFTHAFFMDGDYGSKAWTDANPFNSNFGGPVDIEFSTDIFDVNNTSNPNSYITQKHTKNLIRYMVSRWGAYTSVAYWKLWGEAENVKKGKDPSYQPVPSSFDDGVEIANWHQIMYNYIKTIDPFEHPITTSFGDFNHKGHEKSYDYADLLDLHEYQAIEDGNSTPSIIINSQYNLASSDAKSNDLYNGALNSYGAQTGKKPFYVGETGWTISPGDHSKEGFIQNYDPNGYDMHSTLWSTAVSGAYGCGMMWEWKVIRNQNWYHHFNPVATFMSSQPIPPEDMIVARPDPSTNTNGLEIYTMTHIDNSNPDNTIIYGWCQDENYTFRELAVIPSPSLPSSNYLIDLNPDNKPSVSSSINTITLNVGVPNLTFDVEWYSSETGLLYSNSIITSSSTGKLDISMPVALRNSTYGDGVFKVTPNCTDNVWREGPYINSVVQNAGSKNIVSNKYNGQIYYITNNLTPSGGYSINSYWWNGSSWSYVNFSYLAADVSDYLAISNDGNLIPYISTSGDIKALWWDGSTSAWYLADFSSYTNGNAKGPIVFGPNGEMYYRTSSNDLNALLWSTAFNTWIHNDLNSVTTGNVGNSIVVASNGQIFYKTTNSAMNQLWHSGTAWVLGNMNNTVPASSIASNITIQPNTTKLYYVDVDGKINYVEYDFNISNWVSMGSTINSYTNASGDLNAIDNETIIFRDQQNNINKVYFENSQWELSGMVDNNPEDMKPNTLLAYDDLGNIAYSSTNNTIRRLYYKNICFNTPSTNFQKKAPTTLGTESLKEEIGNKVSIYPNPNNGLFKINSDAEIEKWTLKNALGTEVLTSANDATDISIIKATNLSTGLYILVVKTKNGTISNHKVILK